MLLAVTGNIANADIFMEEASSVSGYGATRSSFSLWYSGHCAERVRVSAAFIGRTPLAEALPQTLQYARDSVTHILARCPQAEHILVNASGQTSAPAESYRFVMHSNDDWAPTGLVLNATLVDALIGEGYLPVQGPKPLRAPAFVRFANDKFDVVYGKHLDGRMTATHVERNVLEGATPEQVSNYVIRGHWFSLGHEQPEQSCSKSREGYPLWGSFFLQVYPSGSNLTVTRKHCVDTHTDAPSEAANLTDLPRRDFERYGIAPLKIAKVLGASLVKASFVAPLLDKDDFAKTRQPLYASKLLRVYSQEPELCVKLTFDAIYRVNSERRDTQFGGDYASTLGGILKDISSRNCKQARTATVDSYSLGDSERWDRMSFSFRPSRASPWGSDADYLQRYDLVKSARAKAHDAWLAANLLGPQCTDGPFCDLAGGRYLNAIYRGDLDAIRQMDHLYRESAQAFIASRLPDIATDDPLASVLRTTLNTDELQLLREAANKYLYSYPAWGDVCFDDGAVARTFEYTTPVVIDTDEFGGTTTSGGIKSSATYTLNPDFFALRDRVGDAFGARDSDDAANLPPKAAVFTGIVDMKRRYQCRAVEVKKFERELRALTQRVINEPGTTTPSAGGRPPTVELVLAEPFSSVPTPTGKPSRRIAYRPPAALPNPGTTMAIPATKRTRSAVTAATRTQKPSGTVLVPSSDLRTRQQQMLAEIQALQSQMLEENQRFSQSMEQRIVAAATPGERSKLLADYQTQLAELQSRMQMETERIMQKYR
ncbi:MAG: hypothetical protein AB8B57_10565 [Congregibacter sp.]